MTAVQLGAACVVRLMSPDGAERDHAGVIQARHYERFTVALNRPALVVNVCTGAWELRSVVGVGVDKVRTAAMQVVGSGVQ